MRKHIIGWLIYSFFSLFSISSFVVYLFFCIATIELVNKDHIDTVKTKEMTFWCIRRNFNSHLPKCACDPDRATDSCAELVAVTWSLGTSNPRPVAALSRGGCWSLDLESSGEDAPVGWGETGGGAAGCLPAEDFAVLNLGMMLIHLRQTKLW